MSDLAQSPFPAGISGRVVNVTDAKGQDPSGNWVPGRNVTYQLSTGHTGTVFVPLSTFGVESVSAAIAADAQKLAAVASIRF